MDTIYIIGLIIIAYLVYRSRRTPKPMTWDEFNAEKKYWYKYIWEEKEDHMWHVVRKAKMWEKDYQQLSGIALKIGQVIGDPKSPHSIQEVSYAGIQGPLTVKRDPNDRS